MAPWLSAASNSAQRHCFAVHASNGLHRAALTLLGLGAISSGGTAIALLRDAEAPGWGIAGALMLGTVLAAQCWGQYLRLRDAPANGPHGHLVFDAQLSPTGLSWFAAQAPVGQEPTVPAPVPIQITFLNFHERCLMFQFVPFGDARLVRFRPPTSAPEAGQTLQSRWRRIWAMSPRPGWALLLGRDAFDDEGWRQIRVRLAGLARTAHAALGCHA